MKRAGSSPEEERPAKMPRMWPAPLAQIERARAFIRSCTTPTPHHVLIAPDKDADGLSSGLVLWRTLQAMGLDERYLHLFLLRKGQNIHSDAAREAMSRVGATRVIVLDQGSRPGRSLVPPSTGKDNELGTPAGEPVEYLLIDHHDADVFPDSSQFVSACRSPPVATTSLLTYFLCSPLHQSIRETCGWITLLGVYGDLGSSTVKFGQDGWGCEELKAVERQFTKKKLSEAVSMLNAPRRTAAYDVRMAWNVLANASGPEDISLSRELNDARYRVNQETQRCQASAPKFSKDGRVALVRITSAAQVHPVIATRWSTTLKSAKKMVIAMCANDGYTAGRVHFSCRLAAPLKKLPDDERPSIIALLNELGEKCEELSPGWRQRVGEDFARGHKEASGGIVATAEFDVLVQAIEIGVKSDESEKKEPKKPKIEKGQQTLKGFFTVPSTKGDADERRGDSSGRKSTK